VRRWVLMLVMKLPPFHDSQSKPNAKIDYDHDQEKQ